MTLAELFLLLLGFNAMTFGNGLAMIPLLQVALVDQRHVLTIDELLYAFTIARVTPGQANVYVAAAGYMLFGWPGAFAALAAVLVPGYLILPLTAWHQRLTRFSAVQGFTRGLTTTSVGLIFAIALQMSLRSLTDPVAWVVFPLTIVLLHGFRWSALASLGAATAAGLTLAYLAGL
jgi:chromate transporter